MGNAYESLVARLIDASDESAEAELLRAKGAALPDILQAFPGKPTVTLERLTREPLPAPSESGSLFRLLVALRRAAFPAFLSVLRDPSAERRMWALFVLTELVYPDAIDALTECLFDDDERVRGMARMAIRALATAQPDLVVERLSRCVNGSVTARSVQAIEALAETREPMAVLVLIPLLEHENSAVIHSAREGLMKLTKQDFGRDSTKWTAWWNANADRPRGEWLLDALVHDKVALRSSAFKELHALAGESFGYSDFLPKRSLERVQAGFRAWWQTRGRFGKAASSSG
jgi:HEAT repeat protein